MLWSIFPCQYEAVGNSQRVCSIVIQLFCFLFPAYRIHVSQSTVDTLRSLNEGYEIVPRGKTELKVRRPGLCEMLRRGIFSLKEFSYGALVWPSSTTLLLVPSQIVPISCFSTWGNYWRTTGSSNHLYVLDLSIYLGLSLVHPWQKLLLFTVSKQDNTK